MEKDLSNIYSTKLINFLKVTINHNREEGAKAFSNFIKVIDFRKLNPNLLNKLKELFSIISQNATFESTYRHGLNKISADFRLSFEMINFILLEYRSIFSLDILSKGLQRYFSNPVNIVYDVMLEK